VERLLNTCSVLRSTGATSSDRIRRAHRQSVLGPQELKCRELSGVSLKTSDETISSSLPREQHTHGIVFKVGRD
jgi:hypothetical protein